MSERGDAQITAARHYRSQHLIPPAAPRRRDRCITASDGCLPPIA